MQRDSGMEGASVSESCICGARFEMNDGGWYFGRERNGKATGDPLAVVNLKEWRASHTCNARPVITLSSQSPG